jgi:glycosyltransferase involved in cell wall biosynthesis
MPTIINPMTSTVQPLVSVVTPAYNEAQHIAECIESVLAQTYTNWDYTIVDNASNDNTLEIARRYAARDSRIRIISNQMHLPVIQNHNFALRQISLDSRYCKIVFADDWIFPDCLDKMVELAEKHPGVAIVGAYGQTDSRVVWVGLPFPSTVIPGGREACRLRLLGGPYVFGSCTAVLFRSEIVRSRFAFYNEQNIHADSEVFFEFLGQNDFGFVHQVLTYRRDRENSLTAVSKTQNTYLPQILYELITYGSKFLTNEELTKRVSEHLRDYYRYLGIQIYNLREQEFWDFHKKKLAELGYPLSRYRVAAAAISFALDLMLNPKLSFERAMRRLLSISQVNTRRVQTISSDHAIISSMENTSANLVKREI